MYKYKPARYFFRALNLIIYAAVASAVVIAIFNEIFISDVMNAIFHNYLMGPKRSLCLAFFLVANVLVISFFKFISKRKTEALLYYICDFIIRITFSIPLSFVVFYFLLYRFFSDWFTTVASQTIAFIVLFAIFDYLMRWQIKFQLDVNYFKIRDKV